MMHLFLVMLAIVGIGGFVTLEQAVELNVSWYHHWSPCRASDNELCIDCFKGWWTLDEHNDFYGDMDRLEQRLTACPSGYFLFGDEWELQQVPMAQQIEETYRFLELRDELNSSCRVILGGINPWHPFTGENVSWVQRFHDAYLAQYGESPRIAGIGIDAYDWGSYGGNRDWVADALAFVAEVRRVYPGAEVWAREFGSLLSHEQALEAMRKSPELLVHLDRWAWFLSYEAGWSFTSLYDADGNLTDLGELYAGLEPIAMHRLYLPQIWRN